ncbi:prolyl oligopeptidase family serine peptidase [Inhella gelatinilytica]|uniref:S9 family peptidase n=1 Tax=Inhella gelatinilytica TaxID=2795030 RepID=A0A931IWK0_9BURK|nr:prolyl oligopeptidase family serine peptidase [Inhella gelatinilytica]MBH9554137.1 S9 family peptidase [Inhella gelatinilytica]
MKNTLLATAMATALSAGAQGTGDDPYLWLEDVSGDKAMAWVKARNAETEALLKNRPGYESLRTELLEGLNAKDRIPRFTRMGDWIYNLWQDDQHKRGLWRRTTLKEYAKSKPAWETVLDLDALGAAEHKSWVFAGANCLAPEYRRCLLSLSPGGSDAAVVREFDTHDKAFVKGGFELPEAKSQVDWKDLNHIYVGTQFGPGSMTDSGYPRISKLWSRGTPLDRAQTLFEGQTKDTWVGVSVDGHGAKQRTLIQRALDFYRAEYHWVTPQGLKKLELPLDAQPRLWGNRLLVQLRSDWQVGADSFKAGSLLVGSWDGFLKGQAQFRRLFEPTTTRSLAGYITTRHHVVLNISDNVASKLEEWDFRGKQPKSRAIAAPFPGTLSLASLHDSDLKTDPLADRYLVNYADFLTPDSLYLAQAGKDERQLLKSRTAWFDSAGMRAEQHFAVSKDGTRVPYFVISPKGAQLDGKQPTLLYGYGGFEVSMTPRYSSSWGRGWLSKGGVLVMSNIRGGGEFGPQWHKAAIRENKQRSYDDFIAIAEDLIAKKITTPRHLGIMGGSNGGLLMGAIVTQRPDLFNAVVCQVPLLDMKRYHTLLAGASWMAEYGDPDKAEDWAFISKYSPYQNVKAGVKMPRVLINTSTKDDRVHPGHARKMAARMIEQGHNPLYWENIEGGHGGAADNEQRATWQALEYSYLWMQLGGQ